MTISFEPQRLSPAQVNEALHMTYSANLPTMIWGPPGVGKSDGIKQFTVDLFGQIDNTNYREVRLSQLDQVDLRGMPVPDLQRRLVEWLTPSFLPREGSGVFSWEELSAAQPNMQVVIYQAILDRRIGEYEFPDGWHQVACGNEMSDRAVAHRMSTALASRFVHLWMQTDVQSWIKWALDNDVPTEVIAFVKLRPELLHAFDPQSPDPVFACPRTWAMAGRLYDQFGWMTSASSMPTPAEESKRTVQRAVYAGTVGQAVATELTEFLDMIKDMPNPTTIMAAPHKVAVPARADVCMVVSMALARMVDRDNFGTALEWVGKLRPEFQAQFIANSVQHDGDVQNTRAYLKWASDHAGDIL